MKSVRLAAAALLVGASGIAAVPAATTKPIILMTGFYTQTEQVLAASTGCIQFAGEQIVSTIFYPGQNAIGYTVRTPINSVTPAIQQTTNGGPTTFTTSGIVGFTLIDDFVVSAISKVPLKTPKAGATSWTGAATFTNNQTTTSTVQSGSDGAEPSTITPAVQNPGSAILTFTYSNITVMDELSAYWTSDVAYPLGEGGGNCVYVSQTTITFVGPK